MAPDPNGDVAPSIELHELCRGHLDAVPHADCPVLSDQHDAAVTRDETRVHRDVLSGDEDKAIAVPRRERP